MALFEKTIEVRWADVDQNRHVRHTAYYDYGAYTRIRFFIENGFDSDRMEELQFGPIIFREECSFIKEIHPSDTLKINLLRGPLREDGSRWTLYHELFNSKGEKCAHIAVDGAWMHPEKRKLVIPPSGIAKALYSLPIGEAFIFNKQSAKK